MRVFVAASLVAFTGLSTSVARADSETAIEVVVTAPPPNLLILVDGIPDASGHVPVTSGTHRIEVSAPGFFTEGRSVQVAASETKVATFVLTPKVNEQDLEAKRRLSIVPKDADPSVQIAAGIVVGAVGLLSLTAAIVSGTISEVNRQELQGLVELGRCTDGEVTHCTSATDQTRADDLETLQDRTLLAAVVLGGASVFLLATGVVVIATAPSKTKTVWLEPAFGPGVAAATVLGRW